MKHQLNKIKDWILDQIGQEISIDQFAPSLILNYKGSSTDSAAFYCPYIPIISTSVNPNIVISVMNGQNSDKK